MFYSKQAGIVSAILYFISPFFFFSGGLFIVPDASLNFSVAGATFVAIKLIFNDEDNVYLWISLGLLLLMAFLSKYRSEKMGLSLSNKKFFYGPKGRPKEQHPIGTS